ncbi:hypothetical protein Gotur_020368 [Gossypium turneri]
MEEGEEGTEKRVSGTTGFIAGQLMMFISIYYVPLHSTLEEVGESEEERNKEIKTISEGGGANQKQGTEENTSFSLFSEEEMDPSKINETEKLRVIEKEKK